ncbi:RxLR effector family [Phytophthora palmivora]|uniref:RxLR effector family n=1 Tax=Phytophthora palmivora TaxID=4796 RepID=A0A2P4YIW0_9STRA|nr:RxLR effector family [Phytophthora palmivora]
MKMGIHSIKLIFAAILLVAARISVATDSKKIAADVQPITTVQNSAQIKGLLRTNSAGEINDEERVITGLGDIKRLIAGSSKIVSAKKLRAWLGQDISAFDALIKLKLNNVGVDMALASPNLKVLENYVDMVNKKYPGKQVSLLGTLTKSHNEAELAMALARAKHSDHSRDIATKLQTQQLEGWLNSQKSVGDIFSLLKVNDFYMFKQKLLTMEEYIKLFNLKNPQQKTNLDNALRGGFGTERSFAMSIWRALGDSRARGDAAVYLDRLFKHWIKQKYHANEVLIKVFKVKKTNLAGASKQVKDMVDAYKNFYKRGQWNLPTIPE